MTEPRVSSIGDLDLTDEQKLLVASVERLTRRFTRAEFLRCHREGRFPEEVWQELATLGVLGITVPEAYGGAGLGIQELALVEETLARAGVPIVLLVVSPGLGAIVVSRHGSEEQKRRWLPGTATGATKFCFAITEPDAGTNTFKIRTMARKVPGGYRVSGQKSFITGIDVSDHMLLVARTSPLDLAHRTRGLSLLVVDTKAPGISRTRIDTQVCKVETQWAVFLDDVFVPEGDLIGEEGRGIRALFDGLNPERILVASMCVGLGEYVLDKGVEYAKGRQVFDGPIAAYQAIQHPMALAKAHLELALLMNRRAARLFDGGEAAGPAANIAKLAAADAALEAFDISLQAHGGNGFTSDYDLLDIYSFLRLQRTAPVSREMILNYIGEHLLGMPKSY